MTAPSYLELVDGADRDIVRERESKLRDLTVVRSDDEDVRASDRRLDFGQG